VRAIRELGCRLLGGGLNPFSLNPTSHQQKPLKLQCQLVEKGHGGSRACVEYDLELSEPDEEAVSDP